MTWAELAGVVAAPVLTALALWGLLRGSADEPPLEGDALVLRYPPVFAVFGWLLAGFGAGITGIIAWSSGIRSPGDVLGAVALTSMFVVAGLWFVAAHRRERVWVRTGRIEERNVWGRSRQLGWPDVERVSFGRLVGALTFHGADGSRLRVSVYLVGVLVLADAVERRLTGRGGGEAARALRAFRQS